MGPQGLQGSVPKDGSIQSRRFRPNGSRGSGITYGHGALWIASTKISSWGDSEDIEGGPEDREDIEKSWVTPGLLLRGRLRRPRHAPGAHGPKWVGETTMAVPASGKLFRRARSWRDCPIDVRRPAYGHGARVDNGMALVRGLEDGAIFKLNIRPMAHR